MNINLHLTDDTKLRAHGYVAGRGGLFAEVEWDFRGPFPTRPATASCGAPPR